MKFELDEKQVAKLRKWQETKKEIIKNNPATIGGAYVYEFNPTGIGTFVTVLCQADNTKIDLDDDL